MLISENVSESLTINILCFIKRVHSWDAKWRWFSRVSLDDLSSGHRPEYQLALSFTPNFCLCFSLYSSLYLYLPLYLPLYLSLYLSLYNMTFLAVIVPNTDQLSLSSFTLLSINLHNFQRARKQSPRGKPSVQHWLKRSFKNEHCAATFQKYIFFSGNQSSRIPRKPRS